MLSVRKLSKVYKPKKGAQVTALDSVDLDLADNGLVFLLGKSGSGKSTLLNLLGGLDSYTSGDIIIKGKSSKDFKQSDFDSYRNTFIGFIFQEFNILEEYTVGKNIGLALELQHKKSDKDAIMELLSQVDLAEYYDRKPNELSGGQKQRVAIARALIKRPEIIMADEPTGALDSKTGRQVFDTLKTLSKDKLVIVVSHDRENAELYGDRIIELADGKIINDRTRSQSGQLVDTPVNYLDTNIVHIKAGYTLTDDDAKKIKAMFQKSNADVFISSNVTANGELNKILESKNGRGASSGSFYETTNADIALKAYDPKDFKLVKSRLPFKDSFKMGASGLKFKKVRLVFTILLSFIAFTLFGFSSTVAAFDSGKTVYQTLRDNEHKVVNIRSVGGSSYMGVTNFYEGEGVGMTPENIAKIEELTGHTALNCVYEPSQYNGGAFDLQNSTTKPSLESLYYSFSIRNFIEFANEADAADSAGITKATDNSKMPTAFNEIALSDYIADTFVEYELKHYTADSSSTTGYSETSTAATIASYSDLIGKTIKLSLPRNSNSTTTENDAKYLTIVGVFKTDVNKEDYAENKSKPKDSMFAGMLMEGIQDLPISMGFVKNGFAKEHNIGNGYVEGNIDEKPEQSPEQENDPEVIAGTKYNFPRSSYLNMMLSGENKAEHTTIYKYTADLDSEESDFKVYYPNGKKTLTDNDIIVSTALYYGHENPGAYDTETEIIDFYNGFLKDKNFTIRLSNRNVGETNSPCNIVGVIYKPENSNSSKDTPALIFNDKTFNELKSFASLKSLKRLDLNSNSGNFAFAPKAHNVNWSGGRIGSVNEFNQSYSSQIYWAGGVAKTKLASNEVILNKTCFRDNSESSNVEEATYKARFDAIDKNMRVGKMTYTYEGDKTYYDVINGRDVVAVGMSLDEQGTNYVSDDVMTYLENLVNMPKNIMISLNSDWSKNKQLFDYIEKTLVKTGDFSSKLQIDTTISSVITFADSMLGILKTVFIYVALAFSLFAALMLMNFIGTSIANKKKEIGVLRAIGARSTDVFKIFLNEGLIIGAINFVLAGIALAVISIVLNSLIGISVLVPGILQYLLMAGVSLVVVLLATYLPVRKIARKKPIDAINNR